MIGKDILQENERALCETLRLEEHFKSKYTFYHRLAVMIHALHEMEGVKFDPRDEAKVVGARTHLDLDFNMKTSVWKSTRIADDRQIETARHILGMLAIGNGA